MPDDRTDRELLVSIRDRKEIRAFEELVRRWDGRLIIFLERLLADAWLARDLRQETYIRIWRSAATYNDSYAASTWISRIATNLARTHARRARPPAPANGSGFAEPITRDCTLDSEQAGVVRDCLERLPLADKELLLMRFQLELTYPQIADLMGCPETTAKSRMAAIIMRLRKHLEHQGINARNILP